MTTRSNRLTMLAAASVGLIALTACGGSGDGDSPAATTTGTEPVTLTLATFNQFGYDELIKEYEKEHTNVTITHKKAATSNEARDNLNTRLAAGSGLSDIEAVEVDWLAELMQYSSKFTDLSNDDVAGRWLDWKAAAATDADGRLIGYGTDSGPEAICYRGDLFEKAGLPSDREEVATLLGDSWESYFEAGKTFSAKSDVPWFDSLGATYQGMINQIESTYEMEDGTVIATDNPEVRKTFDAVVAAGIDDGLSAKLQQWSPDWTKSFTKDGFATMLCPGWMVGVIEGNAKGVKGWDVANTFPGGGGNWGGSYLTVPTQSKHPAEARALAEWLTAPEQQVKAFVEVGAFPSQTEALESEDLAAVTSAFLNDAPTGEIFAERAKAVTVAPFKGPKYFPINDAMQQALTRIEDGSMTPDKSWDRFVKDVEALG
ncbi:extracellular solute-binding protein [Janibacter sp. G56]|uniref:ABC transporter substrate-binding protein n=1 Tax=Janibacter sp. G56 TaxID=3418717 RepID=UPI003CFC8DB7